MRKKNISSISYPSPFLIQGRKKEPNLVWGRRGLVIFFRKERRKKGARLHVASHEENRNGFGLDAKKGRTLPNVEPWKGKADRQCHKTQKSQKREELRLARISK